MSEVDHQHQQPSIFFLFFFYSVLNSLYNIYSSWDLGFKSLNKAKA